MTKLIILHGLGQTIKDWDNVVKNLDCDCLVFNLFEGITSESTITIESMYSEVSNKLDSINEPFYLSGLSLGGLLALMYTTRNNNRHIKGIIVSGAIYKSIPKWINNIQTAIFQLLPKSNFEKMGLNGKQAIDLMKSIDLDLEEDLSKITLPTLIICGEKDKINLKSSKQMSQLIKESELQIVLNGGHELNKDKPLELSKLITNFIGLVEGSY
ncbi:hypothetical protein DOK76_06890 [Vagococcus sp. DIV0080]|uniref:AB hydrolase-1 domain-containing protein n=1 Tax=Candidatus Vagococcus giribetii TaxID=2230876 RepID=A0ABS3HSQ1_9ENTE|nr:alpha/beta fold hydrolase [Vagococcus sp. DIV0080]MBO0476789.1 hypothetical protein [Vagococcus sp. DIV0080]